MSDLQLNATTGDIDLAAGDFYLNDPLEAVRQHLVSNLRAFRSEWFLNLDQGVPYFQEVLRKNPNPIVIDAIFKEAIINTVGVKELTSFDLTFDTESRKMFLDFSVDTIEGELNFENLVVG